MANFDSLVAVAEDEKQSSYKRRQAVTDLLKNHQDNELSDRVFANVSQSDDSYFVREIVSAVRDINAPQLLPVLRQILATGDDYTKRDVIQILGKSGSQEDLDLLEPLC